MDVNGYCAVVRGFQSYIEAIEVFVPSHDVEIGPGCEVPDGELRHREDEDADADVDEVEGGQAEHQRVKVPLDL